MRVVKQSAKLIWCTDQPERTIERIARVCYKSEDKITKDSSGPFIRLLLQSGHFAMIEHASASFHLVTDRGISHELVRHRLASYAQESTRYCNYGGRKFRHSCTFVLPSNIDDGHKRIIMSACRDAEHHYFYLVQNGTSPQIARAVLPNCLKTEIVMTANFREWLHFLKLRTNKKAHPQMVELANLIKKELVKLSPTIFTDLSAESGIY